MSTVDQHNDEIQRNADYWQAKPVLRQIYRRFHDLIAAELPADTSGHLVELGSGIPDITEAIPGCLRTDLFPNPWLDQVENAYDLSFQPGTVSALILFDVFHHLRYPGTALQEFQRVLAPRGRVIIFDPCVSLLGRLVYGLLHDEPLALRDPITPSAPPHWSPADVDYYAAQGNATRAFLHHQLQPAQWGFRLLKAQRHSAISYVLSGGYSKPQMYPTRLYGALCALDRLCDALPALFATRLIVVLEKVAPPPS